MRPWNLLVSADDRSPFCLTPKGAISRQQLGCLVVPGQLFENPSSSEAAHLRTADGIIQQLKDLLPHIDRIIFLRVQSSIFRCVPALAEIKLYNRLCQGHVFHDLIHCRFVIHVVKRIGIHAHIRGIKHLQQLLIGNASRESNIILDTEIARRRPRLRQFGSIADDCEVNVMPITSVNDVPNGFQQVMQSFLPAYHTDIADQKAPSTLERVELQVAGQADLNPGRCAQPLPYPVPYRRARSQCVDMIHW